MNKIGIITNDREFNYYRSLFNKESYELVKIECADDFKKIKKLIITHQPYHLLDSHIKILGIEKIISKWMKENSIITFGFSSIYFIDRFNLFPINLISHKLNMLENSNVYIYPKLKLYTAICLPNLEVEILNENVEVISKWREKIIGIRFFKNEGYFFIPTKETERSLILQYIE